MRRARIAVKYGLDRVCALIALAALVPAFLVIASLIKLQDRGPVFFKHLRPGVGAHPFVIWKFRTMVVNADQFLDKNGTANRNRVTKIGRYLRNSSLDELPQLLNILKGEMSFIGPRPAIMEHLPRYTTEQMGRLRMRPGITGLAQINGRNTLRWSERIRLDNQYIESYSLALDLRIFLRTIGVVLRREDIAGDRNPNAVDDLGPSREDQT